MAGGAADTGDPAGDDTPLADAFVAVRTDSASRIDRLRLELALRRGLEHARGTWPTIVVDPRRHASHVAAVLSGDVLDRLDALHHADLYVARAVLDGDPEAVLAFDEAVRDRVRPALAPLEVDDATLEAALPRAQTLGSVLSAYDGRGSLWCWMRVLAARAVLARRAPSPVREVSIGLDADDTALEELDAEARAVVASALSSALAQLDPRHRTALRLRHVHGLAVDRIAALLGVHWLSARRWLKAARRQLLAGVRRQATAQLPADRLESTLRVVTRAMARLVPRLLAE